MTALATISNCAETMAELFEPVDADTLTPLFTEYAATRSMISELADHFTDAGRRGALRYFIEASALESRRHTSADILARMFDPAGAIKVLDAEYWQRALGLTDVYDTMPQARRTEWDDQIEKRETPPFEPTTVVATLQGLLADRQTFFAERVDGIFRALSGEHVTNRPEGFGKRMILSYVFTDLLGVNSRQAGHINDLRCVIAKFMGRDEPREWKATHPALEYARHECTGQWVDLDGGALRIRCYKKGTAHLEVAPEMAYRLNNVLAFLHPTAIASQHRQRPKRKPRTITRMQRLLSFDVVEALGLFRRERGWGGIVAPDAYQWMRIDKHVRDQVVEVLTLLGGSPNTDSDDTGGLHAWQFDADDAHTLIAEVRALGYVPDTKSHQYYPTPDELAQRVVALAEVGPEDTVLEPSAGAGGLARHLPKDRTTCVEVSDVLALALQAQGFVAARADFLKVAPVDIAHLIADGKPTVNRVVMNPPFDRGQYADHVAHASTFVAPGGRLVSILPSGAPKSRVIQDALRGWSMTWSEPIVNAFANASVSVVILVADKP